MAFLGAQGGVALARRRSPSTSAFRWLSIALALGVVLVSACASGTSGKSPTATTQPDATAARAGQPDRDEPVRWGYNPRRSTRQRDPPFQYAALPPGYRIEAYVGGLQQPTSLAFTPDGRLLVGEQGGAIRVVQDGRLLPDPFYVADVFLPEPEDIVELGLEAITVDPEFEENRYVYVYYVADDPGQRTVLARLRDEDGRGVVDKELLSLDAAPKCCHVAGSMRFAPDGALFVNIGDHQMEAEAQNRGSPFGAILGADAWFRDGVGHGRFPSNYCSLESPNRFYFRGYYQGRHLASNEFLN